MDAGGGSGKLRLNYIVSSLPGANYFLHDPCQGQVNHKEVEGKFSKSAVNTNSYYFYKIEWDCLKKGSHNFKIEYKNYSPNTAPTQLSPLISANCTSTASDAITQVNPGSIISSAPVTSEEPQLLNVGAVEGYSYSVYSVGAKHRVYVDNWLDTDVEIDNAIVSNATFLDSLGSDIENRDQRAYKAVVTFKEPLSYGEINKVVQESGFQALQFGVYGTLASNPRQIVTTYYNAIDGNVKPWTSTMEVDDTSINNDGVLVMVGMLEWSGIESFMQDERVKLLDVSTTIIRDKIYAELGLVVQDEEIHIPNPAWSLYEAYLENPTAVQLDSVTSVGAYSVNIALAVVLIFLVITTRYQVRSKSTKS